MAETSSARILTVPNLVSFLRLLLVPLLLYFLFGRDNPAATGWLLGIIGGTDWIDGYLARRLGQVSEFGKFLDPVADRLAVAVAVVGGLIHGELPAFIGWGIIVREVGIALGAAVVGLSAGSKLEVRYLGKVATFGLYASISWFLIGEGTPLEPLVWTAWIMAIPSLGMYYVAAGQYLGDARRILREAAG